ncbi:2-hydroxyacid dehydrogenase [Eoetvoesiella caeni]|uniref:Lactate dehydrogenase-like 2-hydroxyacid dehydrogenase n=1 Tax=Eoetvoesiella caeni TaxID=645616 RepID=A0A366HDI6_9BURK|nr:2-hydroxyacid dehydrogenase [Eoetvoesiella caeni]MCI2809114.1 2-hydroxyacid dehydrogenase [Eoetvoesiella caeni]NYT55385.1 2-hydroxyacid dehydrogenase [Eoetvoesiella caeni]RBP39936.1 hypothetical protein DFR37_10430 [Eoetvoesiella caeni]
MKPLILIFSPLTEAHRAQIAEQYQVLYAPNASSVEAQLAAAQPEVRAVLTNGPIGVQPQAIDAMPKLELICTLGVGYEKVAIEYARSRGIALANGAGTNSDCVADHAMAILLAAVRNVVQYDAAVRNGVWRDRIPWSPNVSGRRLGLLGLGDIGMKIARRAQAFDIEVGYHSRSPRTDVAYGYYSSAQALAHWCDFLVVATPGGAQTRHMVDAAVLDALGPQGFVVNISRGSVVDTAALGQALLENRIAGAALDVYESEPNPPAELVGLPNVVLTPHIAGWSPEAVQNSVNQFLRNAEGHFAGRGPVSPIVGSAAG